jgi:hypothetical protein
MYWVCVVAVGGGRTVFVGRSAVEVAVCCLAAAAAAAAVMLRMQASMMVDMIPFLFCFFILLQVIYILILGRNE